MHRPTWTNLHPHPKTQGLGAWRWGQDPKERKPRATAGPRGRPSGCRPSLADTECEPWAEAALSALGCLFSNGFPTASENVKREKCALMCQKLPKMASVYVPQQTHEPTGEGNLPATQTPGSPEPVTKLRVPTALLVTISKHPESRAKRT